MGRVFIYSIIIAIFISLLVATVTNMYWDRIGFRSRILKTYILDKEFNRASHLPLGYTLGTTLSHRMPSMAFSVFSFIRQFKMCFVSRISFLKFD